MFNYVIIIIINNFKMAFIIDASQLAGNLGLLGFITFIQVFFNRPSIKSKSGSCLTFKELICNGIKYVVSYKSTEDGSKITDVGTFAEWARIINIRNEDEYQKNHFKWTLFLVEDSINKLSFAEQINIQFEKQFKEKHPEYLLNEDVMIQHIEESCLVIKETNGEYVLTLTSLGNAITTKY